MSRATRRLAAVHSQLAAAAEPTATIELTPEQLKALPPRVREQLKGSSPQEVEEILGYMKAAQEREAEAKRAAGLYTGPELMLPTIAPDTPVPATMMGRLAELGLVESAKEMDEIGYTIVRNAIPVELVERLKLIIKGEALLQSGMAAKGEDVNLETSVDPINLYLHSVLYKDQAFEEVLAAPKPMALIHLLLGKSALMASMGTHFKGPGTPGGAGEVSTRALPTLLDFRGCR